MQGVICRSQMEVLRLHGHLNAANTAKLRYELIAAVSVNNKPILLVDMAQVKSLDSFGLKALIYALSLSRRLDKKFCLCSLSPSVEKVFELMQLEQIFSIYKNYADIEELVNEINCSKVA